MDHFHYQDGVLYAEDVNLEALAQKVGTPFYCYASATIARHFDIFRQSLSALDNPLIAYAVKANPNVSVIATLAKMGAGADVVSQGEMIRALEAGVPPERIVFSGVGKTREEMAAALKAGIYQFNLESESEAEDLSAVASSLNVTAHVAWRVNPDVDAGTHAKISTGKAENKFGIPIDAAPAAFHRCRQLPNIAAVGVAMHIGSQLTALGPMERAFERMGQLIQTLRAQGHHIERADLGGGLGVPYSPHLPVPPSPADYGAMVTRITRDWNVRLIFEPGRLIVGNAGILVSRVVRIKQGATTRFVIVDAAMNDLLRPSLYDAWHGIVAVRPRGGETVATIVGPVCETGDTFAEGRTISSDVQAGDLVAFQTAGAYGATMASSYNTRPLVPEVLVHGKDYALVRARPDYTEILAAEPRAPWLA